MKEHENLQIPPVNGIVDLIEKLPLSRGLGGYLFFLLLLSSLSLNAEEITLKAEINKTIISGKTFKLKITSIPINQVMYSENWDFYGNLIPPKLGDKIMSELTEDVFVDTDLVLPHGTIFYGQVSNIIPPKRFGRDGKIQVSFYGLKTPAGKTLQFQENYISQQKEPNKAQKITRGVSRVASFAGGGAVAGTIIAYQVAGLLSLAVNPQYILGTGAGLGLLFGTVASIVQKGQNGKLSPGDEIIISLDQNLVLPIAEKPIVQEIDEFVIPNLNINILSQILHKDDLDVWNYNIKLDIKNNTNLSISAQDFALIAPYNKILYPNSFSSGNINFDIDFPAFEHILILRERFSQEIIYKKSLGRPERYIERGKMQNLKKRLFGE